MSTSNSIPSIEHQLPAKDIQTVEVPCPLCASKDAKKLFWTLDHTFKCSDQPFGVNRCKTCGCGYLSPRPTVQDISRFYPQEFYWSWEGAEGELDWASIIEKRKDQLEAKARWLADLRPGRLLDIGAQKGEFLWFMQQRGWQVGGVELGNSVPNPGDVPIRYGDFLSMDFAGEQYDVITYWAVLEHVYDPADFIAKAVQLLKPGGRLVVLVTNLNSIQSRFYQADDYPRHLTLFTHRSVRNLCKKYGLRLSQIKTDQSIFGGTLNGGLLYWCKRISGYTEAEVFAEWKQLKDPDLFWCKWRGEDSIIVKMISRIDRVITLPFEGLLDRLGFGFIMTFAATKKP